MRNGSNNHNKNRKKLRRRPGHGLRGVLGVAVLLAAFAFAGQGRQLSGLWESRESSQTFGGTDSGERPALSETAEVVVGQAPGAETQAAESEACPVPSPSAFTLADIPVYAGQDYIELNGNKPVFSEAEKNADVFEFYSELDALGRCGYAEAKLAPELMPTEERGAIGQIRPSGWHTVKYEGIDGNYLYNRCHLIGYQLAGENANEKNLITGTRHMNAVSMLPWENLVADYIRRTGGTVLYRVTPLFDGNNLLASGVEMEAESLESDEIRFHVFVYNVQPGIAIDYTDGSSRKE